MRRLSLSITLSLCLALAGCKDDPEEAGSDDTAGGEDDGSGGTNGAGSSGSGGTGGSGSGSGSGGASGNPNDDWDGDDDGSGSSGSGGSGNGNGNAGSGSSGSGGSGPGNGSAGSGNGNAGSGNGDASAPETNPWGQTRAEQCAAPARPQMNSAARSAFQNGVSAASRGDTQSAQQQFIRALGEDSRAYRAAFNLGVLADRAGNEAQALDYYRQALRILPDFELAAEGIVNILMRRNQTSEAVALVGPIAQQHRANLAIQALHARVLGEAGQYDASWAAARRALECDERYVPALLALVRTSLRQNRKELAESILTQAINIDGSNAEALFIRGTLYRDQPGRLREALEAFQRAVELRPDYVEARIALGLQLLAGGNYPQAIDQFESALRLAPSLVAVHLNLADALRASRQWERAKAEFDVAMRMDPNLAQVHFNLGLMYQSAGADSGTYPGMTTLQTLQKAVEEFTIYRNMMGPRLARGDVTETYLQSLQRQIERLQRQLDREARARQEESQRGESTGE